MQSRRMAAAVFYKQLQSQCKNSSGKRQKPFYRIFHKPFLHGLGIGVVPQANRKAVRSESVATKSPAVICMQITATPGYLYIFVERYLNALSARITTIFFPAASGRFAIWVAVQRAAPADWPTKNPSWLTSFRPVS